MTTVPALTEGACQVWWARPGQARPEHLLLLPPAERARHDRLLRQEDRNRMVAAYAVASLVLGAHVGGPVPAFDRTCLSCGAQHGKPRLPGPVQFSLSHAGDRVAVAVVRDAEVGVDVEQLRPGLTELVGATLAPDEAAELAAVSPDLRDTAFLTYWTRKEALLKATGEGLTVPLPNLSVTGLGEPPRLRGWRDRPGAAFTLHDLTPGAGYLAAVAIDTPAGPEQGAAVVTEHDATALLG